VAIFGRRGPDAPTALYEVGRARGWRPTPAPHHATLQPPSFARVDVERLGEQGARSQAWVLTSPDGMTASHLEVFRDGADGPVYDMVGWGAPDSAAALPHVEIVCGQQPYHHHRLSERFGQVGSVGVPLAVHGLAMNASRACTEPAVAALARHPGLSAVRAAAEAVGRGGFTVEVHHGRAAVFTLTTDARRGTGRWRALIDGARHFAVVLDDVTAPRQQS